jgi:hypothetical protein
MKKNNIVLSAAIAVMFSTSIVSAEAEVTGKIIHESAIFTDSGIGIGGATTVTQTANSHGQDVFKTATQFKIFVDGDAEGLSEGSAYHVELNLFSDGEGVGDYDSNKEYTQNDALREAYIDTEVDDISLRIGKQQVVWGTADGMKLLDNINPTDYTEMAQNQMEDSRIPIWMINAETEASNGGSWQVFVSEAKSNIIAGMGNASGTATSHTNGDSGHAFIMKGVDTLTGKVHGFMNMAPALGKVATYFASGGQNLTTITSTASNANTGMQNLLQSYADDTVADFVGDHSSNASVTIAASSANAGSFTDFRGLCGNGQNTLFCDAYGLDAIAEAAAQGGNQSVTNLIDANTSGVSNAAGGWATGDSANSLFEYMDKATFGTFAAFVNMNSKYVVEEASGVNTGFRFKNTTKNGLNYSLNYMNHDDANPYVDLTFQNTAGANLTMSSSSINTTIQFKNAAGAYQEVNSDGVVTMVMTEKHANINSIGGSFDTAIETADFGPVVLRGEAVYDIGVMTPIVDRAQLRIGNALAALTNKEGNRLSYVLGADITALTNMMVSAQFIQIRNLDYVDSTTTIDPTLAKMDTVTGARYTADSSAMHMTNGLKKAEENKEFYSLFFSKPFGASGEHRWNNITMYEENGGKWNRLDAEFSIDDDTQATVEYNKYWGDVNTQFGQLAKSSNIQVGVKYSF